MAGTEEVEVVEDIRITEAEDTPEGPPVIMMAVPAGLILITVLAGVAAAAGMWRTRRRVVDRQTAHGKNIGQLRKCMMRCT